MSDNEIFSEPEPLDLRNEIQEEFNRHPVNWFEWVFQHLLQMDLPDHARLLELGCGTGQLWARNPDRLPAGWRVVVSDLSLNMVQEVRRTSTSTGQAAVLDSGAIPFAAGAFDAVLAVGLFDTLPDLKSTLTEIRRVLAPGGVLAASGGSRRHLSEMNRLLAGLVEGEPLGGSPERFGLENGADVLQEFFSNVNTRVYRDWLVFDDAAPVLAYLLSEAEVRERVQGVKEERLRQRIGQALANKDAGDRAVQRETFSVTIEKVFFSAVKR